MLSSAWYPLPRKSLPKKHLEKGATDLVGGRSATMSLTLTNPGAVSARRSRVRSSPGFWVDDLLPDALTGDFYFSRNEEYYFGGDRARA